MKDAWLTLMKDSLLRPRLAARSVLSAGVAPRDLVAAAVATASLGIVLGYFAIRLSGGAIDRVSALLLDAPLLGAASQFAVMGLVALATFRVGRLFGGSGGFWGAVALVVWLDAMMIVIQTVQLVALALVPPIAALLAIATLFWAMWAFANFVTELHGFKNPVVVLGGVVLTGVMLFVGIAILIEILGLSPGGAA